jgi:hypothetical protein
VRWALLLFIPATLGLSLGFAGHYFQIPLLAIVGFVLLAATTLLVIPLMFISVILTLRSR